MTDDDRREWQSCLRLTLHIVTTVVPHLINLSILSDWEPSLLCAPLAQLRTLRAFSVNRMNVDELRVLATLPNLEKLSIYSIEEPGQLSSTHVSTAFPRLENLHIVEHPNGNRLYPFLSAPLLRKLTVSHYKGIRILNLRESCAAWSRWFPLLESLYLGLTTVSEPIPGYPQSYSDALKPIFRLRSLKSVQISAPAQLLHLDDEDIQAISRAWPKLSSAIFIGEKYDEAQTAEGTAPCLSPSSLVSLALDCPRLHTLELPRVKVDLKNVAALSDYPVLNHPLSSLHVERMFTTDCSLAALLIDRIFPHLDDDVGGPLAELTTTWEEVMYQLSICRMARQQHAERPALLQVQSSEA